MAPESRTFRFENYKKYYADYCRLAHKFRCDAKFDAKKKISNINLDWHPLGAAIDAANDPCNGDAEYCRIEDWNSAVDKIKRRFGSRVFLVQNLDLSKLSNRYLIEFENPSGQLIPEIGIYEAKADSTD